MSILYHLFLGALIGGIIGPCPAFLFAWLLLRRRRRVYREMRERVPEHVAPEHICDVRYASAKRLKSSFKIYPWEMIGVLFVDGDGLTADLQSGNGKRRETLRFVPERDVVEWRGTESFFRNGLLHWVAIGEPEQPAHYFTAETGVTIFGSKDKTQEIVRMLQSSLHMKRCMNCDYELWGNTTGVCSECGTPFARPDADRFGLVDPVCE